MLRTYQDRKCLSSGQSGPEITGDLLFGSQEPGGTKSEAVDVAEEDNRRTTDKREHG